MIKAVPEWWMSGTNPPRFARQRLKVSSTVLIGDAARLPKEAQPKG